MRFSFNQSLIAAGIAMVAILPTGALARTAAHKSHTHKMASTMKCPACGMAMPSKASAKTPVKVVVKGHAYYCCTACPAGKAHSHKK